MTTAAALILSLAMVQAPAADLRRAEVPLTPEQQQAKCAKEGGCFLLTRAQLMEALVDAHEIGREKGQEQGELRCSRSI